MGRGQRQERPIGQVQGRVGSRWLNYRPSSEEVAAWFKDNVQLHEEGLDHEHYVGGMTLIGSTEYVNEVRERQDGDKYVLKVKNLVLTPYCKVETRVAYFWDYMLLHPEWVGIIEPVDPLAKKRGQRDTDLPPGFYRTSTKVGDTVFAYYACSMRVRVLRRERNKSEQQEVIAAPPATKLIPALTEVGFGSDKRVEPDPYALMKAETGAVGRALGLAGMLVVPGAGVATAEDMLEAQAQGEVPSGEAEPVEPELPGEGGTGAQEAPVEEAAQEAVEDDDPEDVLRQSVAVLIGRLESENPEEHKKFQEWAKGRKLVLAEAQGAPLRGAERKLKKLLKD